MVLVFDISGDMAMFRKPYTTTSLISYPFPPPTAVAGLLGAITGVDNQASSEGAGSAAFWDQMSGTRIAIGQKRSVRWMTTAVNLIKYKDASGDMAEHIQAKHQMVKDPAYRIYVSGGDIYSELKIRLEKNEFIYTPYLGVAYALADIEYIGEFEEESGDDNYIDTIVPVYGNLVVDIQQSKSVHKELVPYRMDTKRGTIETVHIFYSEYQKSKGLWIQENGDVLITRVGDEGVAWFETW
ncbi:MAG TPA: type I-B CRISPR-associated protein Cas5 [Syntrophomonadaceae bacterium]|nr:type I-B CRISPR-associated protein Cas5 [Syntrophomonadaceae bacterium]